MKLSSSVTTCYQYSISKLRLNMSEFGLLAASPHSEEGASKRYTSLFSRDIGVSSLGILLSQDKELIQGLKQSLIQLGKSQSRLGQIPFYYKPESNQTQWWNPGSIDSTLWWCIALLQYYHHTEDHKTYDSLLPNLESAFTWLQYQDTNNDSLLEQGESSDWADEMPRQGTVLYSNALWYWLVSLKSELESHNSSLSELKKTIHEAFNTLFWVHKKDTNNVSYIPDNEYTRKNTYARGLIEMINVKAVNVPYYIGFVSHKNFELRCDVFGNILACFVGLADEKKASSFIDFVFRSGINKPYPVKVLYPPIYPGEVDFREYMSKRRQNYPWQYHNGGIWPFVGGFWVSLLAHFDHPQAEHELERLAQANALNDYEFNEFLHGEYGTPMGAVHQSWSMAMFLAAYHSMG